MSRRHHGRPHHGARHRPDGARPAAGPAPNGQPAPNGRPDRPTAPEPTDRAAAAERLPVAALPQDTAPAPTPAAVHAPAPDAGAAPEPSRPRTNGNGAVQAQQERGNGCTAPQLRRFIKSRPYVPMHELRRRFAIDGDDDDVTQVRLSGGAIYVGLPDREGSLLGDLLRGGEIGYELSLDPRSPIVVGVYPMRPVPRG